MANLSSANSLFEKKELFRAESDKSMSKIDDIDVSLINSLNDDFVSMGFESILSERNSEGFNLINRNVQELIRRFNRQQNELNRLQEDCYKLDKENDLILKRQQTLKDSNEASNRELSNVEEKCRQLQLKLNTLNKSFKEAIEENRKLQNTVEQRDKQYKHERKKLEKEIEKLKERVQVLSIGKTKELPHLDLNETLSRSSSGSRATWNSDGSKKQLELYSELIKDYDKKMKELVIENNEVKTFLADMFLDLVDCTNNFLLSHETMNESTLSNENVESAQTFADEIIKLPFENIFTKLKKEFRSKFDQLNENKLKRSCSNDRLDQENNLSLSSIKSDSTCTTRTMNKNKFKNSQSDLINTTFTIETNESINENEYSKKNYKLNRIEEKSLRNEVNTLNSELYECKRIIESQVEFINSFGNLKDLSVIVSNGSEVFENSMKQNDLEKCPPVLDNQKNEKIIKLLEKEIQTLSNERNNLDKEKKLFYEQKLKLEQESTVFRKVSADLTKQKKSFIEEQENFYKSKLYSSFIDQDKSNSNSIK